jgi:uncharacterized protein DUF3237
MSEVTADRSLSAPCMAPVATTFLFRVDATLDGIDPVMVRDGPAGTRLVAVVNAGLVRGPRVSGTLVPGCAGDWVTIRKDRSWFIDVRAAFVTDDGAPILYFYNGVATPASSGRMRIRGAPRFETGDERYAWLNNVQGLAVGETDPRARIACYDIYSLD